MVGVAGQVYFAVFADDLTVFTHQDRAVVVLPVFRGQFGVPQMETNPQAHGFVK